MEGVGFFLLLSPVALIIIGTLCAVRKRRKKGGNENGYLQVGPVLVVPCHQHSPRACVAKPLSKFQNQVRGSSNRFCKL
jgi:hypothetical protein